MSKLNTISDKDYRALQDRAIRTQIRRGGSFTRKAIRQRKATNEQCRKAKQS